MGTQSCRWFIILRTRMIKKHPCTMEEMAAVPDWKEALGNEIQTSAGTPQARNQPKSAKQPLTLEQDGWMLADTGLTRMDGEKWTMDTGECAFHVLSLSLSITILNI